MATTVVVVAIIGEFSPQIAVASHDKVRRLLALPEDVEPAGFPAVYAQPRILHIGKGLVIIGIKNGHAMGRLIMTGATLVRSRARLSTICNSDY
jgi:hypothetical protein